MTEQAPPVHKPAEPAMHAAPVLAARRGAVPALAAVAQRLNARPAIVSQRMLASRLSAARPLRLVTPPPAPADAPVQGVWVKRKTQGKSGATGPWQPSTEGEKDAVDTRGMTVAGRQQVRQDLENVKGPPGKKAREALDAEIGLITGKIDEAEIHGLGERLAELEGAFALNGALNELEQAQLESISFSAVRALGLLRQSEEDDKSAIALKLLLEKYVRQINELDDEALASAVARAESDIDLTVTAEDIAAYRADIAEPGTWGSGAEAATIANRFNFRCRLLILDSHEQYVVVDTIGPANPRPMALLNAGSHYQVVDANAVAGHAWSADHVLYDPPGDGDCLFNALFYVAANGGATVANPAAPPPTLDQATFLTEARAWVSGNLTNAQIEHSIVEIRNSRSRSGLGKRLKARMALHDTGADDLRARFQRTGKKPPELLGKLQSDLPSAPLRQWARGFASLEALIEGYSSQRETLLSEPGATATAEETAKRPKNLVVINQLRDAIFTVIAQNMPKVEDALVASQGQDPRVEARLRREAKDQLERSGVKFKDSPNHGGQHLVVGEEAKEFVMDRIGQLVPRYVDRGISKFNVAELAQTGFMYPTGHSPVPRESKTYSKELRDQFRDEAASGGSGIGSNKIKNASQEMGHVEGVKPSPFLSTTSFAGGTVNPQGESFGSTLYTIDLSWLPASAIAATYTDRGMGYFLLSAFTGSASDKGGMIAKARDFQERAAKTQQDKKVKTSTVVFTAEAGSKEDTALSGKEWQALMDVIRTGEILIGAPVPKGAMRKK